ncbi:nuclear transport factor 2 family protein [Nocardioides sp.]|uniref:nuclear transport factor 2 family protein n=1 Tax=Nocardioides sp. TaxID=35761 RepID=UPI00273532BF|nr:nuclear transport factor 2 family protein [Nocardioides sp.]MDP3890907.1 nuclear transport factor 2 family protein [Nocardioides sp.]
MNLQQLSDRAEIIDLITRYTRAVDTRSWDDLDDVFTEDGVLDYSTMGGPVAPLAEAKPWVAEGLAGFDRFQHVIGQVSVELAADGVDDQARATAYFTNPMVSVAPDGTETLWEVGGYYHHDLVRTPDGWRSQRMVDELVWSRGF